MKYQASSQARKRTINADFWMSPAAQRISRMARLLFVGIFSNADDAGRCQADTRFLKAAIFRFDLPRPEPDGADKEVITLEDIAGWRLELAQVGLIVLYEDHDLDYLVIPDWFARQSVFHPRPSLLPPPPTSPI